MKKVQIRRATIFGKLKILSFVFLCLITGVSVFFGFLLLAAKIHDLSWDNRLLTQRVEANDRAIGDLLEKRAFQKEMRENLSYYLPEGYHSKATFLNLTPVDFGHGKARVSFLFRSKIYYVDFTYNGILNGWDIDRVSPATLKL